MESPNLTKEMLPVEPEVKSKLHLSFSEVITKIKEDIISNS
jgi:hypothetical protein